MGTRSLSWSSSAREAASCCQPNRRLGSNLSESRGGVSPVQEIIPRRKFQICKACEVSHLSLKGLETGTSEGATGGSVKCVDLTSPTPQKRQVRECERHCGASKPPNTNGNVHISQQSANQLPNWCELSGHTTQPLHKKTREPNLQNRDPAQRNCMVCDDAEQLFTTSRTRMERSLMHALTISQCLPTLSYNSPN